MLLHAFPMQEATQGALIAGLASPATADMSQLYALAQLKIPRAKPHKARPPKPKGHRIRQDAMAL